jgi:hypothetical protein
VNRSKLGWLIAGLGRNIQYQGKLSDYIQVRRHTSMKSTLIFVGGCLMIPVCLLGLLYQQAFIWVVCPQALVVMFIRQSQHAYDSLGAADFPDLAVGLLYYPLIGWILSRASRQDRLRRVAAYVAIWHVAAIVLALGTCEFRNRIWKGG